MGKPSVKVKKIDGAYWIDILLPGVKGSEIGLCIREHKGEELPGPVLRDWRNSSNSFNLSVELPEGKELSVDYYKYST